MLFLYTDLLFLSLSLFHSHILLLLARHTQRNTLQRKIYISKNVHSENMHNTISPYNRVKNKKIAVAFRTIKHKSLFDLSINKVRNWEKKSGGNREDSCLLISNKLKKKKQIYNIHTNSKQYLMQTKLFHIKSNCHCYIFIDRVGESECIAFSSTHLLSFNS